MHALQKQGFKNEGVDMKTTELFTGNIRSYRVLYLILLMGLVSSLNSADFNYKDLTRGKVWVTLWNTTGIGLTTGGGEPFRYDYPGYKKGADVYSSYGHVEWAGYMAWADVDGVGEPFRVFNAYDPTRELVVPLENSALIKNYNLVDPTIPAEEMVTGANRMVKQGIDMYFREYPIS